tara:strand:- start:13 stop:186 length:174 start_codon:yes stop_codon:yes gene_type:complete
MRLLEGSGGLVIFRLLIVSGVPSFATGRTILQNTDEQFIKFTESRLQFINLAILKSF